MPVGAVDTAHHLVSMSVLTSDDLGEGSVPTGCTRDANGHGYLMNLDQMTDTADLTPEQMRVDSFDEEDEALMQTCYDQVCELLEDKEEGTRITTEWLAQQINVPKRAPPHQR